MEYTEMIVVRVGNSDRPATKEDIDNVSTELDKLFQDAGVKKPLIFITHYAVEMQSVSVPLGPID